MIPQHLDGFQGVQFFLSGPFATVCVRVEGSRTISESWGCRISQGPFAADEVLREGIGLVESEIVPDFSWA